MPEAIRLSCVPNASSSRLELGRSAIAVVIESLVRDGLGLLPAVSARLPVAPWPDALKLDDSDEGVGLDSLARLDLAARVSELFHVHEVGMEDYLLARRSFGAWIEIVQTALHAGVGALTFRTSGSTGEAKAYRHPVGRLLREAAFWRDWLGKSYPHEPRRILRLVPPHHLYGFIWGTLLSAVADLPTLDRRPDEASLEDLSPGDIIIAAPPQWCFWAANPRPFPPGVLGICSTGPLALETANVLLTQRLSQIWAVYGTSESGAIAVGPATGGGLTLLPRWTRADAERLQDGDPDGEADPLLLSDKLIWLDARRFNLAGRRDSAVQVGGTNVFPARVARLLEEHPEVSLARVRLSPRSGRLEAFIVPAPDTAPGLPARLDAWSGARLSVPERIYGFTLGAAIPLSALGKETAWSVSSTAEQTPVAPPGQGEAGVSNAPDLHKGEEHGY